MWHRLICWSHWIACAGVVQFVCLVALAMYFYPGGTSLNRRTKSYSFSANMLSDLGLGTSWSGEDNERSAAAFNTSVVVLGASIVPFFVFLPTHASDKAGWLALAALLGLISACAVVGIGLTPFDSHPQGHQRALVWWLLPFGAVAAIHFLCLLLSEECGYVYPLISLGLAVVIAVHVGQWMHYGWVSLFHRMEFPVTLAATQKVVAAYSVGWFAVFSHKSLVTAGIEPPPRDARHLSWSRELKARIR